MNNTAKHTERELSLLEDSVLTQFSTELIALAQKFGDSGQSGGSTPYVARALSDAVNELFLQRPISPITQDHFIEVADGMFQNQRDGRVFREAGEFTFIEAIVWTSKGEFTGTVKIDGKEISSQQKIKSFPFTPKTFYVDLVGVGDSYSLVYMNGLEEAREYYDMG